MALDRQQIGLAFRLDADTKPAKADIQAFQAFMEGVITGIRQEAEVEFKKLRKEADGLGDKLEDIGKKGGKGFDELGKKSKASAALVKESVETFSSEIIESFGVDGDIANTLANQLVNLKNTAVLVGIGVTAAVGLVTAGFVAAGFKTAEYAGQLSDLSAKTNLTTDTLQSLRLAATLTGQSLDEVADTATTFQQKIDDANSGNKELQRTFKSLGVDLNGDVDRGFRLALEKLSQMEDGSRKTALAVELFGEGGINLLPILSQVGGSFEALEARARELGIVLSKDDVEAADAFGDQVDLLKLQLDGLVNQIGSKVIPALSGLAAFARSALRDTGGFIKDLITDIATTGGVSASVLSRVAGDLAADQALQDAANKGKKNTPPPGSQKTGAKGDSASDAALRQLQIQLQEEEKANRSARDAIKRIYDQRAIDDQEFANQQIAQANDRLTKELAILDKEKAVVEGSKFNADKKKTELERIAAARKDLERQTADEIERIDDDLRKRLEQAGIAFEQAQAQAQEAALKRRAAAINAALQQGVLSNEEAERQLTDIARKGIENRIALANAEVDRAGQNTQLKAVALEKVKALEIELATAVEAAGGRIAAARARDLEELRRYVEARQRIQQDLQAGDVEALDREARRLERQAGLGLGVGTQAVSARRAADLAQAEFENQLALKRIEDRRLELQSLAETSAQAVEVERLANDQRLAEEERYQQEKSRIRQEARAAELELLGFDQATADAIAQQEILNGRTLELWEQLRVGAQTTVDSLRSTLPSLGALFVETGNTIANALTTSIAAFASGATSVRKAAAEFFKAALAPLKDYLLKKSKIQFAEAIASLAAQDYRGFALHTLAGTALAAAAGLIDAGGSAIAGGGGAVAPSAGGGTNAQPQGPRTIDQGNPINRQPAQVVLVRAEHAPGVVVEIVRSDIANNGVLRDAIQREGGG